MQGSASWLLTLLLLGLISPPLQSNSITQRMHDTTVRLLCIGSEGEVGSGSGLVVDEGRHVVTNWHVVECTASGGQALLLLRAQPRSVATATVVTHHVIKDLAVLRLEERLARPSAEFAVSATLQRRDPVVAVGFPGSADRIHDIELLDEPSFTNGTVSRIYPRPPPGQRDRAVHLVQVDAAINPGNSGGPLFDDYGRVIGVVTLKDLIPVMTLGEDGEPRVERVHRGEGIGWAVVADEVMAMLDALGIGYRVQRTRPNALVNLWHREPLLSGLLGALLVLLVTLLAMVASQRGRSVMREGLTRAYGQVRREAAPAPSAAGKRPVLRGVRGQYAGLTVPLDAGEVAIGRDPSMARLVLAATTTQVSKRHALVGYDADTQCFTLEDCWSSNGTFIDDGKALRPGKPQPIQPGHPFYLADPGIAFEVGFE